MLQRLYVNNFKCLENFELTLKGISSALLIGKNGVGKSTVSGVLKIFQKIGQGINRIQELVQESDFSYNKSSIPMRFELEIVLDQKTYKYLLALELPKGFKELRILEEQLLVNETAIYSRQEAKVILNRDDSRRESHFFVDWHLVALPLIQPQSNTDPLSIFRTWLSRIIILAPIPSLMTGESNGETLAPAQDGSNFSEWLAGLLSNHPASYTQADYYLKQVMPDIQDFRNDRIGKDAKSLIVRFSQNETQFSVDFKDLSDGEKCFFLCATVIAANQYEGPLFCFWDEPDNHLSLSEVGLFMTLLRRSFQGASQILITSHNIEAIRKFSDDNTFFLDRKSHLEPTRIQRLDALDRKGDLINALIRGDLEL